MFKLAGYNKKRIVFISVVVCTLFFVPFFWYKPGELSLGGDSSRLYFYDTLGYLKSFAFYSIDPDGIGKVDPNQYLLPFLLFLLFLKSIFQSNQVLINIIDGLKLSCGFLFIYLVVVELIYDSQKIKRKIIADFAGVLAGLFYIFSPSVTENMKYALLIHNQVFLNPLIFYLLLRFLKSANYLYLWFILFITFIFSPNFTPKSPPPVFAFYPLVFIFLYLYIRYCLKNLIPWKGVAIGLLFFLGLQAFQLIPVVYNALDKGSYLNSRITDLGKNLEYFDAIRGGLGKVSLFLLLPSFFLPMQWVSIIMPFFMFLGFFFAKKGNKILFLSTIFFLITLFFVSANITQFWIEIYRKLFYIPGFSMFRNFSGHWQFVYTFFYALLLGQTIAIVFSRIKTKYVYILFSVCSILFFISAIPFLRGELVHTYHAASKVSVNVRMDPQYHKALEYISSLSTNGKMILLPFNDFVYQVVHGLNNGAYIGPSTVSNIAGMPSYAGYQNMDIFADEFLKLAKQKNYEEIKKLFIILNIRYVFHNDDPKIYNTTFQTFPYGLTKEFLPNNQKDMTKFATSISDKKIYKNGTINVYSVTNTYYPGDFYIAKRVVRVKNRDKKNVSFFENDKSMLTIPTAYISSLTCTKLEINCNGKTEHIFEAGPKIRYKKINPTKYVMEISSIKSPFLLIHASNFNDAWKVYRSNSTFEKESAIKNVFINRKIFDTAFLESLPSERHIMVNGYANAWYIKPEDLSTDKRVIIIEMTAQRTAYISMIISFVTFCLLLIWGIALGGKKLYFQIVKKR